MDFYCKSSVTYIPDRLLINTQVEGVVTCFVAFPAFFLLPAFPEDTTMFKDEEKLVLLERLRRDMDEEQVSSSTKRQVLDALLSWKIWLA